MQIPIEVISSLAVPPTGPPGHFFIVGVKKKTAPPRTSISAGWALFLGHDPRPYPTRWGRWGALAEGKAARGIPLSSEICPFPRQIRPSRLANIRIPAPPACPTAATPPLERAFTLRIHFKLP